MRYAVTAETFAVVPRVFKDLGAAFDYMAAQNRVSGERVEIRDKNTGRLIKFRGGSVQLPALKLTDAMAKVLSAAAGDVVQGNGRTLKGLEDRGLAQKTSDGYRLTNLGRQYRAQKKG